AAKAVHRFRREGDELSGREEARRGGDVLWTGRHGAGRRSGVCAPASDHGHAAAITWRPTRGKRRRLAQSNTGRSFKSRLPVFYSLACPIRGNGNLARVTA